MGLSGTDSQADIVEDQSSADLDAHLIKLETIARVQIALAFSCKSSVCLCCRTWSGFRLLKNAFNRFAQTIQNSRVVGASDIDRHKMLVVETSRANEFLEEFLLSLGSAGADEQVTVRLGRLHRLFQNGVPPWPHYCGLSTVYLTSRSDSTSNGSLFMSEPVNDSQSPLQLHNDALVSSGHPHAG